MELRTTRAEQKALSKLSPFELKDSLIHLAKETAQQSTAQMLNAGRGNPNWVATQPREAFFLFGQFALAESRRVRDNGVLAGMPAKQGIGQRFELFLDMNPKEPGVTFLRGVLDYGVKKGFNNDAWIHELTDSIIGDNYPVPDRMLVHTEQVVHDYLMQELCDRKPPKGKFDIFAVEGGTAAMCYLFDSLMQNGLLKKGDTIALFQPTFTPYIEICHLERFNFKIVAIEADEMRKDGSHTWHYTDEQLDKLADKKIKLAAVVNPSNPPSVSLSSDEMKKIVNIVKKKNPDLMIITDDVYGTFVPGFRSLMAELPQNTIGVYSYSKYFGCTGWRLGVIAVHEDNIYDKTIAKLPEAFKKKLDKRYGALTLEPRKIKFIDRMVADSRNVALNHTAGLSLPQQVQMCFFSLTSLLDENDTYKRMTIDICQKRRDLLWKGAGAAAMPPDDPTRAWYYVDLDFMAWAKERYGQEFVDYMVENYEPVDFLFRVAELSSVVLMDGGGFGGPRWSIRVSLANLNDEDYAQIGNYMRKAAEQYVEAWKSESGSKGKARPVH
jgi:aspartate 4-decarboxylase